MLAELLLAEAEALLCQDHDRAALRRLVGERCELSGLCEVELVDAAHRQELRRLAVAEGDGSRLVEEEHVDVARGLDRAAGHGEHVALHEAVHARDADGREQGADRGRDEGDEEGDENGLRQVGAGVERVRPQRHDGRQEGDREACEEDVERDLVRGLAALGALDEGDHAVEERLPGLLGDLDHEPVGEQARAARDRRAVAARLADDRRGLARDRRLVDRADALDDLAVRGDDLAGLDDDDVAAPELGCGDLLEAARVRAPEGSRGRARRAKCVRLRLATALGDRLGEVPEQHREPEPEGDRAGEPERLAVAGREEVAEEDDRRDDAPDLDDEHDRVAEERPRIELEERVADRGEDDLAGEDALRWAWSRGLLVERKVELEHVHAGLAEEAEPAAVGVVVDQLLHALDGQPALLGDARGLQVGVRRGDVRVDARRGRRDGVDRDVADLEAGVVRPLELRGSRARALAPPSRGRDSSARGWRRSSQPRCTRVRSPTAADGSTPAS